MTTTVEARRLSGSDLGRYVRVDSYGNDYRTSDDQPLPPVSAEGPLVAVMHNRSGAVALHLDTGGRFPQVIGLAPDFLIDVTGVPGA